MRRFFIVSRSRCFSRRRKSTTARTPHHQARFCARRGLACLQEPLRVSHRGRAVFAVLLAVAVDGDGPLLRGRISSSRSRRAMRPGRSRPWPTTLPPGLANAQFGHNYTDKGMQFYGNGVEKGSWNTSKNTPPSAATNSLQSRGLQHEFLPSEDCSLR